MNYLDVGLPHTEFYPKRQLLSPPRNIPMSGLSRKYMGLEPVTKSEIEGIIRRLSQPKKQIVEETPEKLLKNIRPTVKGTGRFVGRKRMSYSQIAKMVERLSNRRNPKEPQEDEVPNDEEEEMCEFDIRKTFTETSETRDDTDGDGSPRRRLSVRFQEEQSPPIDVSKLNETSTNDVVLTRKDSFGAKEQLRQSPYRPSLAKPNQIGPKASSVPLRLNQQTSKSPRSPRAASNNTRLTSPRAISASKIGTISPRAVSHSSRSVKQKNVAKTEVAKKPEVNVALDVDKIDKHVINKVARINKTPRSAK